MPLEDFKHKYKKDYIKYSCIHSLEMLLCLLNISSNTPLIRYRALMSYIERMDNLKKQDQDV